MIVHMNDHNFYKKYRYDRYRYKNKKMLGTILKDIEHSITFKIKCERAEIQDVNIFNSIGI
jgi:hypothetical protein